MIKIAINNGGNGTQSLGDPPKLLEQLKVNGLLCSHSTELVYFVVIVVLVLVIPALFRRDKVVFYQQKRKATLSNDDKQALERKQEFLARESKVYGYQGTPGGHIDRWRPSEFPALLHPLELRNLEELRHRLYKQKESEKEVYLDYGGAALPTHTQLQEIFKSSLSQVLANPHSSGPAAARTSLGIAKIQHRILQHFDSLPGRFASMKHPPSYATPSQKHPGYEMMFTSGTTEALRLVAERFPWKAQCQHCRRQSIFLYARNSHTSVVGIRNIAIQNGAKFFCRSLRDLSEIDQLSRPEDMLTGVQADCVHCRGEEYASLLAIPAECNFGGTRADVPSIVEAARSKGWYTLVDIAKAASTGPVSLRDMNADCAVMSFYKMFGAPTGLGGLFVKQSCRGVLLQESSCRHHHHYQGGGSVDIMLPNIDICVPRSDGLASLMSGSVHFRGILTLTHGFDELERRGGMLRIHEHATSLARELTRRLENLRHGNGEPAIVLSGAWADPTLRMDAGPTVVLNVIRDDGSFVGYNEVSKLASLHHPPIQLRTGCFCNPGACQDALKINDKQALENFETSGKVCGDHMDLLNGRPTGAVRISFGKDSLWEDLDTFVMFLNKTFVNQIDSKAPISETMERSGPSRVTVSELFLFPIKSCAGQRVPRWNIERSSGKLIYDREFALVDTSGTAIRLQACPKMTTISPKIDLETQTMTVSAPGMVDLVVSLSQQFQWHDAQNSIKVCGNKCGGRLWGDHKVSEWFSSYLGIQCWLARFAGGQYLVPHDKVVKTTRSGFANEQALLLISDNAVAALNEVLKGQGQRAVESRHFRPNLVIAGEQEAHVEDQWKSLTLMRTGLNFRMKGRCARCSMVDFDPYSGQKGKTLRALAIHRRQKGQITFGIFLQAVDVEQETWIEEGDEILCS